VLAGVTWAWTQVPSAWAQQMPSRGGRGQVVDRVVAVVEGELISGLDLEFEASVFLIERGALRTIQNPAPGTSRDALAESVLASSVLASMDEGMLARILDWMINQRLITRDADKLQVFPVDEVALEAKRRDFEALFGSRQSFERYLEHFEATRTMLRTTLRREMRAERVLDNKLRLRAQVGEEELRQYHEAHKGELGANFEAVRQSLRDKLTAERYTRLVATEVAQLRRKATIRFAGPFVPAPGAPPPGVSSSDVSSKEAR